MSNRTTNQIAFVNRQLCVDNNTWCSRSRAIVARFFKVSRSCGRVRTSRRWCCIHDIIVSFFFANQRIAYDSIIATHSNDNDQHNNGDETPGWYARTRYARNIFICWLINLINIWISPSSTVAIHIWIGVIVVVAVLLTTTGLIVSHTILHATRWWCSPVHATFNKTCH